MTNGITEENKATSIEVSDHEGKVVLKFSKPTLHLVMEPENARLIGEGIARAAYTAKTGINPKSAKSVISAELRMRLVTRATHIIRNLTDKKVLPGRIAAEVVDSILSEVY